MSPDHDAVRSLLGAYLLGGLDRAGQFRVDAHLSACAECRGEIDRLAPVPELLQKLPADDTGTLPAPPRAGLDTLLRRARPAGGLRRGRRRTALLVGAAAGLAALIVAGVAILPGRTQAPGQQQAAPPASASASLSASPSPGAVVEFVAVGGSGLSGKATLTPRQWGVSVALELSGLPGDGPFVLRVVARGGEEEQAACWGRTTSKSARVTGASSIQLVNVARVTVSNHDGDLLGSATQR